ncbi:MAG: hypothetical protein Q4D35_03165 [Ruminococcus sp.]|nr:hypothetical protein [Ruminococcus sp.]
MNITDEDILQAYLTLKSRSETWNDVLNELERTGKTPSQEGEQYAKTQYIAFKCVESLASKKGLI